MDDKTRTYLALGDSMSIDVYTGVVGGGAVSQFYAWLKWLGQSWTLDDKTCDGCCMPDVPTSATGKLITLTIGGNDLLAEQVAVVSEGLSRFADDHLRLLQALRENNPDACIVVGNIYSPQTPLEARLAKALDEANAIIERNVASVAAHLADIRSAFRYREQEYLCYDIEPSLKGATVIAGLFKDIVVKAGGA